MTQVSERTRATMYFFNQLPEPYRSCAIKHYDEAFSDAIPNSQVQALNHGFDWGSHPNIKWERVVLKCSSTHKTIPDDFVWPIPNGHGDLSNLHEAHTHLITEQYDYINPEHYKSGEKETWERMVEIWGKDKAIAHFEMCAFKYLSRLGKKPTEPIHRDLEKAHWYLNKANELRES